MDWLDTATLNSVECGAMELLIVLNVILLLFLIGTYLSLSGRVKRLEEAIRQHFRDPVTHPEPRAHPIPGVVSGRYRRRSRDEWETFFGGKLLNRLGALALIFAVGFFLKYAFDNDWLNETARVILGGAAGLLLIAGGNRFHRRDLRVFAQGLTGAGAAILYLSIYAAYDFYHLIPQPIAFLLMALVTAAALLLSLRYDARAIALLAWAGGFLTPFLLVTADLNTLSLFVYITLLDAGLIAVLLSRRKWRLLEPLGISATYGTYLTWSFRADLPDGFAAALIFLILWWAMYAGMDLYRSATGNLGKSAWRWAAVAINALGLYLMLMRLSRYTESIWESYGIGSISPQAALVYSEGVATAVISLFFFALTTWIMRIMRRTNEAAETTSYVTETSSYATGKTSSDIGATIYATGGILFAVCTPLSFFTGYGVVIVWALEALALFGFGTFYERRAVRRAGTIVLALSFVSIFFFGGAYVFNLLSNYAPILSLRTGAYWAVGGSLLACAGMMQGRTESKNDHRLLIVFHLAWTFLLLIWGTVEILDYFEYRIVTMEIGSPDQLRNLRQLAVSGVWMFGAVLVMVLGRWMDIRTLRASAIVYFAATVVKVFVFDTMFLDTLYRIVAFLSLSAILIGVSYLYYRNRTAA